MKKYICMILVILTTIILTSCDLSDWFVDKPVEKSNPYPEPKPKLKKVEIKKKISINGILKIVLSTTGTKSEEILLAKALKDKEYFQYKADDLSGFIYLLINEEIMSDSVQLTFSLENQDKYYLASKQLNDGVLINTLITQSNLYENNYIPVVIKSIDKTEERTFNMIITTEKNIFTTFNARLIGYSKNVEGNNNVSNYINFLNTNITSYVEKEKNKIEKHTFFVSPAEYLYYLDNDKYGFDMKIFFNHELIPADVVYKDLQDIKLGDTYKFEKKAFNTHKINKYTFDIKPNPTPLFINYSYGNNVYYHSFDFSANTLGFPINNQPDSMNITFLGTCEDLQIEFETSDFIGFETKNHTRSIITIDNNNVCDIVIKKKGGAILTQSFESNLKVTRGNRQYITKIVMKNLDTKISKNRYTGLFKTNILGKLTLQSETSIKGYIFDSYSNIEPPSEPKKSVNINDAATQVIINDIKEVLVIQDHDDIIVSRNNQNDYTSTSGSFSWNEEKNQYKGKINNNTKIVTNTAFEINDFNFTSNIPYLSIIQNIHQLTLDTSHVVYSTSNTSGHMNMPVKTIHVKDEDDYIVLKYNELIPGSTHPYFTSISTFNSNVTSHQNDKRVVETTEYADKINPLVQRSINPNIDFNFFSYLGMTKFQFELFVQRHKKITFNIFKK